MQRLVCSEPRVVSWQPVELAEIKPDQVRVENEFGVEKHGTMMAFFKGYGNDRGRWDAGANMHRPEGVLWNYPIPLGNMQFGVARAVGESVTDVAVGDRVFYPGAFQPAANVGRQWLWKLDDVDWRSAALLDPGEFALGAVRDGNVRVGESVAIFGLGAIGLTAVQMARIAGASTIIALDPLSNRRDVALLTGATLALDPTLGDAGALIREATGDRGVDVVIDFSGSQHALQAGIRALGYGGTLVYGAFPAPFGAGIDLGGEFHMNRIRIVSSRACSDPNPEHPRWNHKRIQDEVLHLIRLGQLDGSKIVDDPVPFDSLLTEYPAIAEAASAHIKMSVKY